MAQRQSSSIHMNLTQLLSLYELHNRPRSPWSLCGSVIEHWSAETEGLRLDSSWGLRIFSLSHARDKRKKTSFSTITLSGIAAQCILARLRTRVAVQTVLSSFFLSFLFLNAFLGDIKSISSSTVYVLGNKFVLNPPQSHHLPVRVKMTPS